MTTIETRFQAPNSRAEPTVFVAEGDRRARLLRYGGAAVVALSCLWLAGLGIGMLGLGNLPGVTVPIPGVNAERGQQSHSRDAATPVSERPAAPAGSLATSARTELRRSSGSAVSHAKAPRQRASVAVGTGSRPRTVSQPAPVVQPTAQATAAPAPVTRGWTRRGWSEPPSQARPTPAEPVQRRDKPTIGTGATTTTPTTPAPIVPPGQQKKADEPLPTG
jgi:hypothetical protein